MVSETSKPTTKPMPASMGLTSVEIFQRYDELPTKVITLFTQPKT